MALKDIIIQEKDEKFQIQEAALKDTKARGEARDQEFRRSKELATLIEAIQSKTDTDRDCQVINKIKTLVGEVIK